MADTGYKISITVTYDNNAYVQGLETALGFSAFITGTEKTFLFDTGGRLLLDTKSYRLFNCRFNLHRDSLC